MKARRILGIDSNGMHILFMGRSHPLILSTFLFFVLLFLIFTAADTLVHVLLPIVHHACMAKPNRLET